MRRLLSIILFSFFAGSGFCQDKIVKKLQTEAFRTIKKDGKDTAEFFWKKGGSYSANVSQGSLSHWAAGGDNFSLTVSSYLNLFSYYKNNRLIWDHTLDFNFGYLNTSGLGARKNDDRLDLLSKCEYSLSPHTSLAGLYNFRTQLFRGYTFPDKVKTFSSSFLSPAYVLVSLGYNLKTLHSFSAFFSPVTARWTIVKNDSLSRKGLYGVDSSRHSVSELGSFITLNLNKEFNKSIALKSRLDLFSNYKHNPQNIDVFMSNTLAFRISKVFTANWNLDLIYDDDVRLFGEEGKSPALQLKSLIGLGVMLRF